MEEEEWKIVEGFTAYEVSNTGHVRSRKTDRHLKFKVNQYGVVSVGMMRHGLQYNRSVPLLVAQAFLTRQMPTFDTPINLNGDRHDNRVENLLWRPRWFAVAYHKQFKEPYENPITHKVKNDATGEVWAHSWDACLALGLLEKDLVLSIFNRTYVWPLYQTFSTL